MAKMFRRFVRMFQPRFAPAVKRGLKRQTVRKRPKVMPRAGDIIDCREWTGKPYRSKQRKLCEGRITRVADIRIEARRKCPDIRIEGRWLNVAEMEAFANADGFAAAAEMGRWFDDVHGLPFEGIVIYWEPLGEGGTDG